MRRNIVISLLLCANILLFAHSVLAHHHHEGTIVFFNSDGCENHCDHTHSEQQEQNHHSHSDHSHEHHTDIADCNLSNITMPVKVLKQSVCFALLFATINSYMLTELFANNESVSYGEYLEYNYHSPPIHFPGLRGPPVC